MINRSFFRKKSTKIYLALFSIVFVFFFMINISYNNINKQIVDNLVDSTLAYRTCINDCYDELANSDIVANIRKSYLYEHKVEEDYLEEFNTNRTDNKLLLLENKNLKNKEVILYYEELYYLSNKDTIDSMRTIHINGVEYDIKDIREDSNISYIEISSSTLSNLKDENVYIYVFNMKIQDDLIFEYFDNVNNLTTHTADKYKVASTLNKFLDATKILSILITIVSIIIYVVILSNLFYDFKLNNMLEKYLGYTKIKRRFNCYIRITTLLILSLLIALILVFVLSLLLNLFLEQIDFKINYYILIYLLIIEIIKLIFIFIIRI